MGVLRTCWDAHHRGAAPPARGPVRGSTHLPYNGGTPKKLGSVQRGHREAGSKGGARAPELLPQNQAGKTAAAKPPNARAVDAASSLSMAGRTSDTVRTRAGRPSKAEQLAPNAAPSA